MVDTHPVFAKCRCSKDRLHDTLKSFDTTALEEMAEDKTITAACEFCATDYVFKLDELIT